MRYKRINTLALDVSAVPTGHRILVVQPLLTFLKLEPNKLKSVQFHSSRNTIFIGLPDDRSAAATAKKTPRYSITIDGTKYYVPLEFVDEDVIEVRVRDLPPETPADVIQQALQQFGEVRSVTSEVWRDFFPGVPTGVRIARMKLTRNIPHRVTIGNSMALINYNGQLCSRCQKAHPNANCTAEENPVPRGPQKQQQHGNNETVSNQQKKTTEKIDQPGRTSEEEEMEVGDPSFANFTPVVTRRKAKVARRAEQQNQTLPSTQQAPAISRDIPPQVEEVIAPVRTMVAEIKRIAAERHQRRLLQEQQQNNNNNNSDPRLRRT